MATVLVVDDERNVRKTLSMFLERAGYEAVLASNAAEAADLVSSREFDVAVVDVLLGPDNGLDVVAAIGEKQPNTQSIVITGEPEVESARRAIQLHVFDYVSKPFRRNEILDVVRRATEEKQRRDDYGNLQEKREQIREALEKQVASQTQELRRSEQRLRTAGKVAYDLIYEWDAVDDSLEWFGDIDGLLGFEPGELSRDVEAWLALIHPDDQAVLAGAVEHHRKSTEPIEFEYRVRHRDGSYRYWSDHALPFEIKDGMPVKWIGVCTDVTARKHAEQALRESKETYRRLTEEVSDWVWEVDLNGAYTYVSPRIADLLGYRASEVLGKTPFDLMLPDEATRVEEVFASHIERGEAFDGLVNVNMTKDGHEVVLETSGRPIFDDDGNLTGCRGIDRDISERMRAEETIRQRESFLRTLLDAIPIPVFYKDRDGLYLGCNKAFEDFFGEAREQLIGKSVFETSPQELAEIYHAMDVELISSGGIQIYEAQVRRADGEQRDVVFSKAVFKDEKGEVGGLIGAVQDVTGR